MKTTITVLAGIAVALLLLSGCGDNTVKSTSGDRPIASAPASDPRVIIAGMQREFEPAGVPLTAEQQARITEVFDPASREDLRAVFGVLTKAQKQVMVDRNRDLLAGSEHPLTDDQAARMMAYGPGSADVSWNILSEEQVQICLQKSMEERQRK